MFEEFTESQDVEEVVNQKRLERAATLVRIWRNQTKSQRRTLERKQGLLRKDFRHGRVILKPLSQEQCLKYHHHQNITGCSKKVNG